MRPVQEAGLEVLSGCFGLLFWPPVLLVLWTKMAHKKRIQPQHDRLRALLLEFIYSDRSSAKAAQIHLLLLNLFQDEKRYEDLLNAVATFQPGGKPPFHDEVWLAEIFRAFLENRELVATNQEGVWPPPPGPQA